MFTGRNWNILHADFPPAVPYEPPEDTGKYETRWHCGRLYLLCPECGLEWKDRIGAKSCCSAKKIARNEARQGKRKTPTRFRIMLDCAEGVKKFSQKQQNG